MSKKKALLVTTVSGFVPQFEMGNVAILKELGYEVHYASNFNNPSYGTDNKRLEGTGIICHQVDFERSPFNKKNLQAYKQLVKIMKDENIDLVHCHTPMGAVLARLAAKKCGIKDVLYTAHGFHFFKGASIKNWLIYYPVERFLSRYTGTQICINMEDFNNAKKFKATNVEYIAGVGIDTKGIKEKSDIEDKQKDELKKELNLKDTDRILITAGEMIERKNQKFLLEVVKKIKEKETPVKLIVCGHGRLEHFLKSKVKELGVENNVIFTGYRTDIYKILGLAEIFLFSSLQEGLPVAVMEAMAVGLPVVCSNVRGNADLIDNEKGGYVLDKFDVNRWADLIYSLLMDKNRLKSFGEYNMNRIKEYDRSNIEKEMRRIYGRYNR
jgi:glycosyltransferase, family 1